MNTAGRVTTALGLLCLSAVSGMSHGLSQTTSELSRSAIVGTIYDDRNDPHSSHVSVYKFISFAGSLVLQAACGAVTDEDGKYFCPGLEPGRYIIGVQPDGDHAVAGKGLKEGSYAFTLYPGTSDPDAAVAISLAPGGMQVVDITLNRVPTYSITGSVPARRAVVSVSSVGSEGHLLDLAMHVTAEDDGTFRIDGLPAGTYSIRATWFREHQFTSGRGQSRGTTVVSINGDYKGAEIHNTSTATIKGNVVNLDHSGQSAKTLKLISIEDPRREVNTELSPKGYFVLADVPSGHYRLQVDSPGEQVVQELLVNDEPQSSHIITVLPDQEFLTVNVLASSNVGTVQGTTSEPEAIVVAQSEDSGEFFSAESNEDGKYSLTGLGSGNYYLYSFALRDTVEFANPRVLARYAAYMSDVRVGKGSTISGIGLETADAGR